MFLKLIEIAIQTLIKNFKRLYDIKVYFSMHVFNLWIKFLVLPIKMKITENLVHAYI